MLSLLFANGIFLFFRADGTGMFHKESITYTKLLEKYKTRNSEYTYIIVKSGTYHVSQILTRANNTGF
jgi:hypothetical protein